MVVVTTTRKTERMKEYLKVYEFTLTKQEAEDISKKASLSVKEQKHELIPRVIRYYRSLVVAV